MGDMREVVLTDYESGHPSTDHDTVLVVSVCANQAVLTVQHVDDLCKPRSAQRWTEIADVAVDVGDLLNALNSLRISDTWTRRPNGDRARSGALADSEAGT